MVLEAQGLLWQKVGLVFLYVLVGLSAYLLEVSFILRVDSF